MNSFFAGRTASLLRTSALRFAANNSQRVAVNSPRTMATKAVVKGSGASLPPELIRGWYNVFGKSTAMYMTWMVILIVGGELVLGRGRDALWEIANPGRTFRSADWSKFDQFDEDEDDDDEDEDDDDDDE